jgi:hypothetical protein
VDTGCARSFNLHAVCCALCRLHGCGVNVATSAHPCNPCNPPMCTADCRVHSRPHKLKPTLKMSVVHFAGCIGGDLKISMVVIFLKVYST